MASSSDSPCQTPSPLLRLPVELKQHIISYLFDDAFPSLVCLRRTHTTFLTVIPKAQIRSKLSEKNLFHQLCAAETLHPYLLPENHYPCYTCARVLPVHVFSVALEYHFDNDENPSYYWPRCCDDCSDKGAYYRVCSLNKTLGPGTIAPPNTPKVRSHLWDELRGK